MRWPESPSPLPARCLMELLQELEAQMVISAFWYSKYECGFIRVELLTNLWLQYVDCTSISE
jgi:hypothetical protein